MVSQGHETHDDKAKHPAGCSGSMSAHKPVARVGAWLHEMLALLQPWQCVLCQQRSDQARDLCRACAADLPLLQLHCQRCAEPLATLAALCGRCQRQAPAFDQVFAVYLYAQPVQAMLTAFKYRRQQVLGRVLAETAAEHIGDAIRAGDLSLPPVLIPVPLHRWRLLRRGFNQSWLIARDVQRTLARRGLHVRIASSLLQRTRRTRPQAGLDLAARRKNLRAAFRVHGAVPAHVCLVDDVMTSGSTVAACARLLKQAGCERVDVWVLARASKIH